MRPPFTASGAQAHYGVFADAKSFSQIRQNSIVALSAANNGNGFVVQNRLVAFLALLIWNRPVKPFFHLVFAWRQPAQVDGLVIKPIAILVRCLIMLFGWQSVKCDAYNPMDVSVYDFPVNGKANLLITVRSNSWSENVADWRIASCNASTNISGVGNFIIRRFSNYFPYFAHRGRIHG